VPPMVHRCSIWNGFWAVADVVVRKGTSVDAAKMREEITRLLGFGI
jgi:hypothetical protein